eukprot:g35320.t1
MEGLVVWCNENNLSVNVGKTKELISDCRKNGEEHTSIYINETEVERVESVKFFGVQPVLDFPYGCNGQEGTITPLLPQAAQEI